MWLDSSLQKTSLTLERLIADLSFHGCLFFYCGEEQANWKNTQTEIFFDK